MRFNSINIFSDEAQDGQRKKEMTVRLRHDSDEIVDRYLKLLKYYDNEQCKSLNIACNEHIDEIYLEPFAKGYPIVHYPFDFFRYQGFDKEYIAQYWLDVIHDSICFAAGLWHWDFSRFEKIYEEMRLSMIL